MRFTHILSGYLVSLPNEKFSLRTTPSVFLKRKLLLMMDGLESRTEAWHSRHFTASSSHALILHGKEPALGKNPGKADEFSRVSKNLYPLIFTHQRVFQVRGFVYFREGVFFKKYILRTSQEQDTNTGVFVDR